MAIKSVISSCPRRLASRDLLDAPGQLHAGAGLSSPAPEDAHICMLINRFGQESLERGNCVLTCPSDALVLEEVPPQEYIRVT